MCFGLGLGLFFVSQGYGRGVAAMNANAARLILSAGAGLAAVYWLDLGIAGFFGAVAAGFCLYALLLVYAGVRVRPPKTWDGAAQMFIPIFGSSHTVPEYKTIVKTHEAPSDTQNDDPCRNIVGSSKNMGRDGSTNQNVDCACAAIRSLSPVSRHNHMIARTETRGSDAMSPPMAGLRLAVSETTRTRMPESAALNAAKNMSTESLKLERDEVPLIAVTLSNDV
jgi:hypothetical protein